MLGYADSLEELLGRYSGIMEDFFAVSIQKNEQHKCIRKCATLSMR